jgi:hypothetical protein
MKLSEVRTAESSSIIRIRGPVRDIISTDQSGLRGNLHDSTPWLARFGTRFVDIPQIRKDRT